MPSNFACCFLFGVFSAKDIEMYYWNLFYEHTKDVDIEDDLEWWDKFVDDFLCLLKRLFGHI